MHRFPNGAGTKGFWHKELPTHAPEWLPRWDNPDADAGETRTYLVVDEPAALVWAANFGALEWHAWTSTVDAPDQPTYALIDLDPGRRRVGRTCWCWPDCTAPPSIIWVSGASQGHRSARHPDLGPHRPRIVVRRHPGLGGAAVEDGRRGRAGAGQLEVAGQGARWPGPAGLHAERHQQDPRRALQPAARARCAVSAPIEWDELDDPDLRPDGYTIRTVLARLAERGDLFADVLRHDQVLPALH